jgi:hypothetical protein
MATLANIATKQNEVSLDDKIATLNQLAIAANDNKKNVGKLRAFISENPELPGKVTSNAYTIRLNLLEKVVGGDGSRLLAQKNLQALEDRLRGDEPTQIDKLLIEAVLCCWLRLQHAENAKTLLMNEEHRFVDMEFADKMLSKAHSRYLRALTALARVQNLTARKGGESRPPKQKKTINLKNVGSKWQ